MSSGPARNAARARPPRYQGTENRRLVLEAALRVISEHGFAGASTRAIAAEAGLEQGHLAYYFPSKLALWREVIEEFARSGEAFLRGVLPPGWPEQGVVDAVADPAALARQVLPGLLREFAANPRLTRIMLQEFSVNSERRQWLVDSFARPVWDLLRPLLALLAARGYLGGATPEVAYFSLIGAALITFGNDELICALTGAGPATPEWLDTAIAHMLVPILGQL